MNLRLLANFLGRYAYAIRNRNYSCEKPRRQSSLYCGRGATGSGERMRGSMKVEAQAWLPTHVALKPQCPPGPLQWHTPYPNWNTAVSSSSASTKRQ